MARANLSNPGEPSFYDILAEICCDPRTQRLARKYAGDLAEDALQETYYTVARAHEHVPIRDVRAYFCRALINRSWRMRQELAHAPFPVDDPDQAVQGSGQRRGGPASAGSAEHEAIANISAGARRALFRQSHDELLASISASSPDPVRYKETILALAARIVAGTGEGPANQAEINENLVAGYAEWFNDPGCEPAALYQRRCRARDSIQAVLLRVIGPDDLSP